VLGLVVVGGMVATATVLTAAQTAPGVRRTVYFTVTTSDGTYVDGLTAGDLTVKEDGRDRTILRVQRSEDRLKVCLAIDEGLSADDTVRNAALRFVERLQDSADIALYFVGGGTAKVVDYTSNPLAFRQPLTGIRRRTQGGGNLVESLYRIARDQRGIEGRRVVVILTTEIPQRSGMAANGVLDVLRDTGAVLHAATLAGTPGVIDAPTPDSPHLETMDEVERDRVLNEGPKQSGGLRVSLLRLEAFPPALERIRAELLNEYMVTYTMPEGSRSDGRITISPKRKGLTVRAARQLPKLGGSLTR
jgi:hypothetical protein